MEKIKKEVVFMKHLFEVQCNNDTVIFDLHKKLVTIPKDTYYSYIFEDEDMKEIYSAIDKTLIEIVEKMQKRRK